MKLMKKIFDNLFYLFLITIFINIHLKYNYHFTKNFNAIIK